MTPQQRRTVREYAWANVAGTHVFRVVEDSSGKPRDATLILPSGESLSTDWGSWREVADAVTAMAGVQGAAQTSRRRGGRPWTREENKAALDMWASGARIESIADYTGRSPTGVIARLRRLGVAESRDEIRLEDEARAKSR